jgi:hypothetical protein
MEADESAGVVDRRKAESSTRKNYGGGPVYFRTPRESITSVRPGFAYFRAPRTVPFSFDCRRL